MASPQQECDAHRQRFDVLRDLIGVRAVFAPAGEPLLRILLSGSVCVPREVDGPVPVFAASLYHRRRHLFFDAGTKLFLSEATNNHEFETILDTSPSGPLHPRCSQKNSE